MMPYKLDELLEAKEHNGCTPTGLKTPNEYKGLKECAHCEREFVVNTLKVGREPKYCSPKCRVAAYRQRHEVDEKHPLREKSGLKGGTDERYLLEEQLYYTKKIYELLAKGKNKKERKKPHAFIKRRRDVSFNEYLPLIRRYNKIYGYQVETKTEIKGLTKLYKMLKSKKAETYKTLIEHQLNNLERKIDFENQKKD